MARRRYYKPRSYRNAKEDVYWRKKLITNILGISAIVILIWLVGLKLLSGLDNFWNILGRNRGDRIKITAEDTIAPQPPYLSQPPKATKEKKISVSGVSEDESEIELFVNDKSLEKTLADKEGKFNFSNIPLDSGVNTLYAKAKDAKGNESGKSTTYTITVSDDKPVITLESPKDGDKFEGKINRTITVKGAVKPVEVEITINGTLAIVDENGNFSLKMSLDQNGENEILIKAKDLAGNETIQTVKVTYVEEPDSEN